MSDEIDQILEAYLQEALPMIERIITRALRDGRKISELAFDLERGADDQTRGGCAPRAAVAKRWREHPDLNEAKRTELADMILAASPDDVPIAMKIHVRKIQLYGVKVLEGELVFPEKPS
jgi:hypothetical protein